MNGGYTQADVTAFAEVITGWSIGGKFGRFNEGAPGRFAFRAPLHEPGEKRVLGKAYADSGHGQGIAVLRDLATKPATAEFIATKLARHFIADEPPAAAVAGVARAFRDSGGDLPAVYRALFAASEGWAQPLAKYKTPCDYIISTFRGLGLPVESGHGGPAAFELLGQRTYSPGSPAGWPDRSADWDGSSALLKRSRVGGCHRSTLGQPSQCRRLAPQLLGDTLSQAARTAIARAASGAQALTLLLTAPEFLRR